MAGLISVRPDQIVYTRWQVSAGEHEVNARKEQLQKRQKEEPTAASTKVSANFFYKGVC